MKVWFKSSAEIIWVDVTGDLAMSLATWIQDKEQCPLCLESRGDVKNLKRFSHRRWLEYQYELLHAHSCPLITDALARGCENNMTKGRMERTSRTIPFATLWGTVHA